MMNDTRTISAKETMVDMSDTETARDTETMSEGEIARAKHVQVGEIAPLDCSWVQVGPGLLKFNQPTWQVPSWSGSIDWNPDHGSKLVWVAAQKPIFS